MRIGKKFDRAKREYDESTKSFDCFCNENNIAVENTTKKKSAKYKFWLGFSTAFATAAVVVCAFIPLMLKNSAESESPARLFFGDNDIVLERISLEKIQNNTPGQPLLMFNTDYVEECARANVIYARDERIILGYQTIGVVYFTEIDGTEFLYEFDCMIRTDERYESKDLVLYQDCSNVISNRDIDFHYKVSKGDMSINAYVTFEYGDNDYYICLYERDYTVELSDENIREFIQLAF